MRDFVSGSIASLLNGTIMRPLVTQKFVNQAHDRRVAAEVGRISIQGATDQAIRNFFLHLNKGPYQAQHADVDVVVEVSSGWSKKFSCPTSNIIVYDRNDPEWHYHYVVSEEGEVLIDAPRRNTGR